MIFVGLFWRLVVAFEAYLRRREYEQNLWKLLLLAFIGALVKNRPIEPPPSSEPWQEPPPPPPTRPRSPTPNPEKIRILISMD